MTRPEGDIGYSYRGVGWVVKKVGGHCGWKARKA